MKRELTLAAASLLLAGPAAAQDSPKPESVAISAHVHLPGKAEPTDARIKNLKAPNGFQIEKFAEDLVNPRMLARALAASMAVVTRKPLSCR